ncbi:MAG: transcriptional factor [Alcanivorax sp.]|nr:transcriptional factor [Alcanivorax sp.]MAY09679.1 transcriptional factor [Alcanivorax sp.]MBI55225.1 transcriptional factor [Alcanivorax sp.]|tara:strand:+ start:675 stop:1697 length:1023 start_codon:yes stop_codon:yes gene_type:complete
MDSPSSEPLARLLVLYALIPRNDVGITAGTLEQKLKDRGFQISERSVQRDLKKIAEHFPIGCHDTTIPYRWYKIANTGLDHQDVAQSPPGALAYYLVEQHLDRLLPQNVLDYLSPRFQTARRYLDGLHQHPLHHWTKRVRSLPNGKALLPAALEPQVWEQVSTAVAQQKQLSITYLSRSQSKVTEMTLNPAGLVNRHSITYLIANVSGYEDLRRFALHRIKQAKVLDEPSTIADDFDLDAYIDSGALGWQTGEPEQTTLVADIRPQLAWLLQETPLSEDQTIGDEDSGWHRLTATVSKNQETLWWILGLNSQIRVWAPQQWAEEVKVQASATADLYSTNR